jgi:hypothetical protein
MTLTYRSTRDQGGDSDPILVTARLHRILQLLIFVYYPFTRTFIRSVDAGIQDTMHDLEPARKVQPNPCHRALAPHPSASYLCLLSIYPYVHSLGRCWDPRNPSICFNTVFSFDPESARQLQPSLSCTLCPTTSWKYSQLHQSALHLLLISSDQSLE